MSLVDLNFSLLDVLNKVKVDKFGRVSAFLAINKPIGITSHDVVDQVRKALKIRNVGHVGALDPFASGILLVLAGKEYTRLSEQLMQLDKAYEADVLLGVATDSLDVEGKVNGVKIPNIDLNQETIEKALKEFEGGYEQYVPVFSSVKVNGQKLRVLARQSKDFKIMEQDNSRFVEFEQENRKLKVDLPKKEIRIENLKVLDLTPNITKDNNEFLAKHNIEGEFLNLKIHLDCSKGTYVRQFAFDLGLKLDLPGMLIGLKRTQIGNIKIENTISIDEVKL